MRFLLFHLDKSGREINEILFVNIKLILVKLLVFHLDISGKENKDEHPKNIKLYQKLY